MFYDFRRNARRPSIYWARSLFALSLFIPLLGFVMSDLWQGVLAFSALLWVIFVFRSAFRSMKVRSLSEERKQDTLALLLTTPLRPVEIVLSKMLTKTAAILYPAIGLIPGLAVISWFGWLSIHGCLATFVWLCSLLLLIASLWVAATSTRTDERNAAVLPTMYILILWIGLPVAQAFLLRGGSPTAKAIWSPFLITVITLLNPTLTAASPSGSTLFFWGGISLNLCFSALLIWFAVWKLSRDVYPVRGKLSFGAYRFGKRLRRMIPWRRMMEAKLLQHYPLAWLNVRTSAWIALPMVMTVFSVGIVWLIISEKEIGFSGFFVPLVFVLLAHVKRSVDKSLKMEKMSRMNEIVQGLPISALEVVRSRLVECAFGMAPSLSMMSLGAVVAICMMMNWGILIVPFTLLMEALLLSGIVCMGTHVASTFRMSLFDHKTWGMIGILVLIVFPLYFSFLMPAFFDLRGFSTSIIWLIVSLLRNVVDMIVFWILFRWLQRRVAFVVEPT